MQQQTTSDDDNVNSRSKFWDRLNQERPGEVGLPAFTWQGVQRHGLSFFAALVVAYGGVALLLLLVVGSAILGAVLAATYSLLRLVFPEGGLLSSLIPEGAGGTGLGVFGGFVGGALTGLLGWLQFIMVRASEGPAGFVLSWLGNMLPGLIVAGLLLFLLVYWERPYLRFVRGCRRMSRREEERLQPILDDLCETLETRGKKPTVMIHDRPVVVQAYAHIRHLVLYRTTMDELDDEELAGLLAHEIGHWQRADAVGVSFVYLCALPVVLIYNLAVWSARTMPTLITILIWLFAWPAWASVRFVLAPIVGIFSRKHEYRADRTAVDAGYGEGLYRVLERVRDLEPGRSGWEETLSARHPAAELRMEAIERAMEEPEESPLQQEPACASCGAKMSETDRFCRSCGATLDHAGTMA